MSARYFRMLLLLPLLLVVLASGSEVSIRVYITGHLKNQPGYPPVDFRGMMVLIKCKQQLLAQARVDSTGTFHADFIPPAKGSIDFFCAAIGMKPLLLASVQTFDSDTPDMNFPLPAIPEKK
ncbi:hypothetical protein [Chitinophaga eiseniae]|uniref:Carboxypeptidase regulatory-like domain-containing protein n=1 Tax=Chitinophaga eiseniae TaxID=634771 RepID=A0A847SH86_9BACT|nr:hypothetical protein [Chitinophaga eiseniae]NLR78147.1 hypothetical protein [Chitinophaga eiseniae]